MNPKVDIGTIINKITPQVPKACELAKSIYDAAVTLRAEGKFQTIINQTGDTFGVSLEDYIHSSIYIMENLVIPHRGNYDDYLLLSKLQLNLANIVEGDAKTTCLRKALETARRTIKISGAEKDSYTYYVLARAECEVGLNDKNLGIEDKVLLYKSSIKHITRAIKIAEKDNSAKEYLPRYYNYLDLAELGLANLLEGRKKLRMLKKSQKDAQKSIRLAPTADAYFNLAEIESELIESYYPQASLIDPKKKQELIGRIIEHYKKSYDLDKNTLTLERIRKIETSLF